MAHDSPNDLAQWLQDNAPDCGDNSCMFGGSGKGGMRTNGGCRCLAHVPFAVRTYFQRLYQYHTDVSSAKH